MPAERHRAQDADIRNIIHQLLTLSACICANSSQLSSRFFYFFAARQRKREIRHGTAHSVAIYTLTPRLRISIQTCSEIKAGKYIYIRWRNKFSHYLAARAKNRNYFFPFDTFLYDIALNIACRMDFCWMLGDRSRAALFALWLHCRMYGIIIQRQCHFDGWYELIWSVSCSAAIHIKLLYGDAAVPGMN